MDHKLSVQGHSDAGHAPLLGLLTEERSVAEVCGGHHGFVLWGECFPLFLYFALKCVECVISVY